MDSSGILGSGLDVELNYVILFHGRRQTAKQSLITLIDPMEGGALTELHGLDPELVPTLPILWYCLHLPRNLLDTIQVSSIQLAMYREIHLHHRIFLLPIYAASEPSTISWLRKNKSIIFCPDEAIQLAADLANRTGGLLPPSPLSQIGQESLEHHWNEIAGLLQTKWGRAIQPPKWTPQVYTNLSWVPLRLLLRRMPEFNLESDSGIQLSEIAIKANRILIAKSYLAREKCSDEDSSKLLPKLVEEAPFPTGLNVSIACTGVALPPAKRTSPKLPEGNPHPIDEEIERRVTSFLAVHDACGRQGVAIELDKLPVHIFNLLDQIESHCKIYRPKPKFVWKMLRRIGSALASHLGEEGCHLLSHAKTVTSFSEIPFGLAILPERTAPISCQIPVMHRSLSPLTRSLQLATLPTPFGYLKPGFSTLIAECLDDSDPIYPLAKLGWEMIASVISGIPGASCDIVKVDSTDDMNRVLSSKHYDVLLVSGHGFYEKTTNSAGIMIGKTPSIGLELERVPPVVLLSACHVAPRGYGAVTIADILFGKGALAVLATLIPVDVRRNSLLMTRLFVYIGEAVVLGKFRTLAEIWTHVMATNAVNEILQTSESMMRWAHKGTPEQSVIHEFQLNRSVGRLRAAHVYEDSERILQEIADERGFGSTFRSTLQSQSYFPESLFYYFLGHPDRVLFHDPILDHLLRENTGQ